MISLQHDVPSPSEDYFIYRGPIRTKDRQHFFGRKWETDQALRMLRKQQSVSIVGPKCIGKTSLLYRLLDPEVLKECGVEQKHVGIYIDGSILGGLTKPEFYNWLWQETRRALANRQEIRVQFPTEKYRHIIVQEFGVTTARTSFSFVTLSAIQFA